MNLVGHKGRGESVWLAWFLAATLRLYAPLAESCGEGARAAILRKRAEALAAAAEEAGWDGAWYRRAFFDDGSPLGGAQNEECRIDLLAQAWAVLSGAARGDRARKAMQAVREQLVREEQRLVLLLAPPFDRSPQEPGYIKGYPPGIRENGGQYTHAAVWAGWAFAALGDGDEAFEIFRLLNPILRCKTADEVQRYRVEPYVYAGDIGALPPHVGRGGWSWYTGSAGWGWRFGIEAILGLRLREGQARIDPCIPHRWTHFEMTIKKGRAIYQIRVENPDAVSTGVVETRLDGRVLPAPEFPLDDDGKQHSVQVRMGNTVPYLKEGG